MMNHTGTVWEHRIHRIRLGMLRMKSMIQILGLNMDPDRLQVDMHTSSARPCRGGSFGGAKTMRNQWPIGMSLKCRRIEVVSTWEVRLQMNDMKASGSNELNELTHERTNEWMRDWLIDCLLGWLVGWLVGRSIDRMDGWMHGWMDGWMNEWMKWTNERMKYFNERRNEMKQWHEMNRNGMECNENKLNWIGMNWVKLMIEWMTWN